MSSALVIEDEIKISSLLVRALAAEGFVVQRVGDGHNGLDRARTGRYDVVILDLRLPGLDGISVLRGIKESQPDQPVLVLSAITDAECRIRCLRLGAFDYVSKPFQLTELVLRVKNGVQRPLRAPAEEALRVGRAMLDLQRRVANVGKGPVRLSEREFFLARHLMRRAGEVCTREELLSAVWGYTFDSEANVLDVYIARLRCKLGADTIETVRNVGYCFLSP